MKFKLTIAASSTCATRILFGLAAGMAGLLAGCSNKPPGCADSAVKQSVIETVVEQASKQGSPDGPMNAYIKKLKMDLLDVTTSGYDEGARKHTCQATLVMTDPRHTTSLPLPYTVQGIEGSRGEYRVACYDTGYPTHLRIWNKAQSYLNYVAENSEPAKPEVPAPAKTQAQEPPPAVAQSTTTEVQPAPAPATAPTQVLAAQPVVVETPPSAPEASRDTTSQPTPPVASQPQLRSPSFSCQGNLSAAEQLICSSSALAVADSKMAGVYAQAIAKSADSVGIKRDQREWRKARDNCPDVTCMQSSYEKRIQELSR